MIWNAVQQFPLEQDLRGLSQLLTARGMVHRIVEVDGAQLLEIDDLSRVAEVQAFIASLSETQLKQIAQVPLLADSYSAAEFWGGVKMTPVSALFILLSCLGALIFAVDKQGRWLGWISFLPIYADGFGSLQDSLARGQLWRFITPAFIHFGFMHLLFNSLWIWVLGRRLELYLRWRRYLILFFVSALVANLSQYIWTGISLFGGMSGVIYAFVGYLALAQRLNSHPLLAVPAPLIGFMLAWLLLCMTGAIDFFISGSVANAAHLGGLIAGLVYAWVEFKLLIRR